MAWFALSHGLRRDKAGAEEIIQVVPALMVAIVCVGLVMAAAHSASTGASEAEARMRADLQAEVFLDSLRADRSISNPDGVVSLDLARAVENKALNLSFVPPTARLVSLTWFPDGSEVFLVGNVSSVTQGVVLRAQPVPVLLPNGDVHPGLLRVAVVIR